MQTWLKIQFDCVCLRSANLNKKKKKKKKN